MISHPILNGAVLIWMAVGIVSPVDRLGIGADSSDEGVYPEARCFHAVSATLFAGTAGDLLW